MSPVAVPTTTALGRSSTASRSASGASSATAGHGGVADAGEDHVGPAGDALDDDDRRHARRFEECPASSASSLERTNSVRCAAAACCVSVAGDAFTVRRAQREAPR